MLEFIAQCLEWLVDAVERFGYVGIFVMMFLESTFFPFPSEVSMIPAGFLAAKGRMDFSLAVVAGILGSLAGALLNYYLASVVGVPILRRYGKYIFFDESKLERCNVIFRKHGELATFVCRLIPVVRQYISLPAGISGMNLARFGLYTGLGAGIWVAILAAFGYWVGMTVDDANPTWSRLKETWAEHKSVIYPCVALGLVAIVAAYIGLHIRARGRRKPIEVDDSQTPSPDA